MRIDHAGCQFPEMSLRFVNLFLKRFTGAGYLHRISGAFRMDIPGACFRFPMCMVVAVVGVLFTGQQVFLVETVQRVNHRQFRVGIQHIGEKLFHPSPVGEEQIRSLQAHQVFWAELIIMETARLRFRHIGKLYIFHTVGEVHHHDI